MQTKEKKGTGNNQSADRAFTIIEYMVSHGRKYRLKELAEGLEMSPSTVLRFLNSLIAMGYVIQDEETQRYFLTFKLCNLGQRLLENYNIIEVASPFLQRLGKQSMESVCLAIEQNQYISYVSVIENESNILSSKLRVGTSAPMYCTGIGKLFLAHKTEEETDRIIKGYGGLKAYTEKTITDREQLREELLKVRKQGYALDWEEREDFARCIAAPVYDYTGRIAAGISITGPAYRIGEDYVKQNLPVLKDTARKISRALGCETEESGEAR